MARCEDCIHYDMCKYRPLAIGVDICDVFRNTADVVSKSEVDLYRKQVDELEDELASTYDKLEKAKVEVETLKDNNEHLAVMLEEAKSEVERLKVEKDALIKNYAECMKDYARKIFAEIEKIATSEGAYDYVSIQEIAELKKKYTKQE